MTHRHRFLLLLLALMLIAALASTANSQDRSRANSDLAWNVLSTGGGHSASTSYTIDATFGQPIIDRSSGATASLSAGFWQSANESYRVFLPIVLK